jgi:hypothetical protein
MKIKPGDTIRHKPSGERWFVAAPSPDGSELVCCGWPESIAKVEDCEMIHECSKGTAAATARDVIASCSNQLRGSWARRWLDIEGANP